MAEPKYTVTIERDDEADFAWRLTATHDGECVLSATDNGAPEDNLFLRDYDWIKPALERAYALGVADGGAERDQLRAQVAALVEAIKKDASWEGARGIAWHAAAEAGLITGEEVTRG